MADRTLIRYTEPDTQYPMSLEIQRSASGMPDLFVTMVDTENYEHTVFVAQANEVLAPVFDWIYERPANRDELKELDDLLIPRVAPIEGTILQTVDNMQDGYDGTKPSGRHDVEDISIAEVVTSKMPNGHHKVVMDIDIPAQLIPSSTPGHSHLYIDVEMTAKQWRKLMRAMVEAGISRQDTTVQACIVATRQRDCPGSGRSNAMSDRGHKQIVCDICQSKIKPKQKRVFAGVFGLDFHLDCVKQTNGTLIGLISDELTVGTTKEFGSIPALAPRLHWTSEPDKGPWPKTI